MLNEEELEKLIKKVKSTFKDIEKEEGNVLVVAHGSSCLTMLAISTGNREEGGKIVREHSGQHGNTAVSFL